mmetsp:Transcript_69007/g.175387  ORF Transcript_69007/g.175387 Transcript_69007/m.175387 type:complete len:271 (+) Transcript_69007:92-904(+)
MPADKLFMSSVKVPMASLTSSMAISASETVRSKPFFLSSAVSIWPLQYSFFCASSWCSRLRTSTMLSIILSTLSKPPLPAALLPEMAIIKRSRAECSFAPAWRLNPWMIFRAWSRLLAAPVAVCKKLALLALGIVFLKRSRASSSLSTLMVSAKATCSSARVLERTSHSFCLESQPVSNSLKNSWSASKAAWVSERSSLICTMLMPNSPICLVLVSMEAVRADTSLFFAAIISSNDLTPSVSWVVASSKDFCMVSLISLMMPVTSPLEGM